MGVVNVARVGVGWVRPLKVKDSIDRGFGVTCEYRNRRFVEGIDATSDELGSGFGHVLVAQQCFLRQKCRKERKGISYGLWWNCLRIKILV